MQWRDWSAETFAEATRVKKPVFVFVTANWCHGGHEMERLALSDPDSALRLNRDFIPIKLNRDAHPETDVRLQQAVATLNGARGWPLTAALTSDGEIFFGSTYMPVQDDFESGKAGFRSSINQLADAWREDGTRIAIEAAKFCRTLKKSNEQPALRGTPAPDVLGRTALKLRSMFERDTGAFSLPSPARFPAPRALELLLAHNARTGDKESLECVTLTLDAMLRGGIYDQLEGGFHRYSIDQFWRVPRFEKLPVLNAEMVCVLLHAWQITGSAHYRSAVEQTLTFWLSTLDARREFFCASVAPEARSFEDGAYYTWSLKEIERLFSDPLDVRIIERAFGVRATGDQPQTAPGRNVLHVAEPLNVVAKNLNLDPVDVLARLNSIRETLRAERRRRPSPALDSTPLCDANAMLAAVFITAGRLLARDDFAAQGVRTLSALILENGAPRPPRHALNDPQSIPLAIDEAARAWACATAYEETGDKLFLKDAIDSLERLERDYRDVLRGGYGERSLKHAPDFARALNWRTKSVQDTSEPSSNGMIAQAQLRVHALTGDLRYLELAETTVGSFGRILDAPSLYNATLAGAADALQNGITRVKVIGKSNDINATTLLKSALSQYRPWQSVQRFDSLVAAGEVPIANLDDKKAFVLIINKTESEIAESVEELKKLLQKK